MFTPSSIRSHTITEDNTGTDQLYDVFPFEGYLYPLSPSPHSWRQRESSAKQKSQENFSCQTWKTQIKFSPYLGCVSGEVCLDFFLRNLS